MSGFKSKKRKTDRESKELVDTNQQQTPSVYPDSPSLSLPKQWKTLNYTHIRSQDKDYRPSFLYGATYSKDTSSYSIYITDLSNVWLETVGVDLFQKKANNSELNSNPLDVIFETISKLFDSNFSSKEFEIKVNLTLNGDDLEMKASQDFGYVNLNWYFNLTRLLHSESVKILGHIILQISSLINNIQIYQGDLIKQIEKKDSTIRYFHESLKGLRNGEGIINRYGGSLQPFDQESFKSTWIEKHSKRSPKNGWDLIRENEKLGTWDFDGKVVNGDHSTSKTERPSIKNEGDAVDNMIKIKDEFQSFYEPVDDLHLKIEEEEEVKNELIDTGSDGESDQLDDNTSVKKENIKLEQSQNTISTFQLLAPSDRPKSTEPLIQNSHSSVKRGFISKKRKVKKD